MSGEEKVNGVVAAPAVTSNGEQNGVVANAATATAGENGSAAPKIETDATVVVVKPEVNGLAAPSAAVLPAEMKKVSSAAPSEVGTEENYDDEDDVDPEEEQLFKTLEQKQAEEDLEEALHPNDKPKTAAAAPTLLKAAIEAGEVKAEDEDAAKKGGDDQAGVSTFFFDFFVANFNFVFRYMTGVCLTSNIILFAAPRSCFSMLLFLRIFSLVPPL